MAYNPGPTHDGDFVKSDGTHTKTYRLPEVDEEAFEQSLKIYNLRRDQWPVGVNTTYELWAVALEHYRHEANKHDLAPIMDIIELWERYFEERKDWGDLGPMNEEIRRVVEVFRKLIK